MRMKSTPVFVAAALLLASGMAGAQMFFAPYQGTFFQDRIGLVQKEQVRQEIKLEPADAAKLDDALRPIKEKYAEQVKTLQKLPPNEARQKYAKFRESIREESHKAIAAALPPRQLKRLKQIEMQQRGVSGFDDPDVQKALDLSEAQKAKMKEVADKARQEKNRALRTTGLSSQAMQRINDRQLEETVAVLTKEQQKTWQDLVGAPFTLRPGGK